MQSFRYPNSILHNLSGTPTSDNFRVSRRPEIPSQPEFSLFYILPFEQNIEHLFGTSKTAVCGEENVDVSGVDLVRVGAQVFHQSIQGARLEHAHFFQTPLLESTPIIAILSLCQMKPIDRLINRVN